MKLEGHGNGRGNKAGELRRQGYVERNGETKRKKGKNGTKGRAKAA